MMSDMERVEFYSDDLLMYIIYGFGPEYSWEEYVPFFFTMFNIRGLIRNLEVTDEHVRFNAIVVRISRFFYKRPPWFSACAYDWAGNKECDEIERPCMSVSITPGIYLFQNLTLPNNYYGYIGKCFIWANFITS
jgi:hypothetical protein